ncbi:hypothetical protein AKG39_10615 [Acetobacterium bakii]|uniref:DUF192 domain-containing protein n=2 Tax=Acetobacterium bakii TaxID=52689 RepID=A0A0L6U009_9FIRM|nr:hypothetical protein AKG39_10615 [Acetobacterium bakii]
MCKALKNGAVLADEIRIADHFFQRLVGLLKDKTLSPNQGLLLNRCRQVHTIGMKFPIDVIFLSEDGEVLLIQNDMRSGQISPTVKGAFWCLELMSGTVQKQGLALHDQVAFQSL